MEALEKIVSIMEEITKGNYSNDIMPLTSDNQPENIRKIAEAVGMLMVKVEAREYQLEMVIKELKELNETLRKNTIKVVSSLANALESRDNYTVGHTARVSELAVKIATYAGLKKDEIEYIRLAGILHDIGKIGFPDLLFQPHEGRLPKEMVKEITRHPQKGAKILENLDFLGPVLEFVHCHHERPDGKGYPRHLTDKDIPLGAKIIAVADSYDAITTDRPYQKGASKEETFKIFDKYSGAKWDSNCVKWIKGIILNP